MQRCSQSTLKRFEQPKWKILHFFMRAKHCGFHCLIIRAIVRKDINHSFLSCNKCIGDMDCFILHCCILYSLQFDYYFIVGIRARWLHKLDARDRAENCRSSSARLCRVLPKHELTRGYDVIRQESPEKFWIGRITGEYNGRDLSTGSGTEANGGSRAC